MVVFKKTRNPPTKNSQPTEKTPQAGKPKVINSSQLNSASNQDLEQSLSCHSYQNTTLQTSSSFHVHFCRAEKQHKLFHCTVKLVVPFADWSSYTRHVHLGSLVITGIWRVHQCSWLQWHEVRAGWKVQAVTLKIDEFHTVVNNMLFSWRFLYIQCFIQCLDFMLPRMSILPVHQCAIGITKDEPGRFWPLARMLLAFRERNMF